MLIFGVEVLHIYHFNPLRFREMFTLSKFLACKQITINMHDSGQSHPVVKVAFHDVVRWALRRSSIETEDIIKDWLNYAAKNNN
jgi:hypothetical protein